MRLNDSTDLGLRIVIFAASCGDRLFTIDEITATYRMPRSTVMKVVNALTQGGFLIAQRGRSGGLRLARPAAEISVAAVVRHLEPGFGLVECMRTGNQCVITSQCRLIAPLRQALEAFLAVLGEYSIADIALTPEDFPVFARKVG
ncbi:RrF2 family transcriptional regulator [Paracoccus aerodenitrificans]|uniref:RrF2 family transcriptional regulator n=1 Tax=Paracoccus aerodenitrificans TaxID=3017781 RepID=UPI0022EFF7D6|nr:Rrf2 family transcriptional regulator [Paracoccus aerodenitrificans]WBU63353.1 Rrf2 family transcriptional regulator [Paracoccus aerodenitrificans]